MMAACAETCCKEMTNVWCVHTSYCGARIIKTNLYYSLISQNRTLIICCAQHAYTQGTETMLTVSKVPNNKKTIPVLH
jgi:hypothetical protein